MNLRKDHHRVLLVNTSPLLLVSAPGRAALARRNVIRDASGEVRVPGRGTADWPRGRFAVPGRVECFAKSLVRATRFFQCVSGVRSLKPTVECWQQSLFRLPAFWPDAWWHVALAKSAHGPRRLKSGRGCAADTRPNPSAIVRFLLLLGSETYSF